MSVNKVRGYSLFNEVKDENLQARNRAMAMTNIMEDNLYDDGRVTQGGMQYSIEYYEQIPEDARALLYANLQTELKSRGMLSE